MNGDAVSGHNESVRRFLQAVGRGDAVVNAWIGQGVRTVIAVGVTESGATPADAEGDLRLELSPIELLMDAHARRVIAAIHAPNDARNCRVCVQDTSTEPAAVRWPCPTFQALTSPFVASGRL